VRTGRALAIKQRASVATGARCLDLALRGIRVTRIDRRLRRAERPFGIATTFTLARDPTQTNETPALA
jgi:hypothetical protein